METKSTVHNYCAVETDVKYLAEILNNLGKISNITINC